MTRDFGLEPSARQAMQFFSMAFRVFWPRSNDDFE
jgi:hypothetical protein